MAVGFFTTNGNKVIHTSANGVEVYNGRFGSDMALAPGKTDEFYLLTDRGANADSAATGSTKIFPIQSLLHKWVGLN